MIVGVLKKERALTLYNEWVQSARALRATLKTLRLAYIKLFNWVLSASPRGKNRCKPRAMRHVIWCGGMSETLFSSLINYAIGFVLVVETIRWAPTNEHGSQFPTRRSQWTIFSWFSFHLLTLFMWICFIYIQIVRRNWKHEERKKYNKNKNEIMNVALVRWYKL